MKKYSSILIILILLVLSEIYFYNSMSEVEYIQDNIEYIKENPLNKSGFYIAKGKISAEIPVNLPEFQLEGEAFALAIKVEVFQKVEKVSHTGGKSITIEYSNRFVQAEDFEWEKSKEWLKDQDRNPNYKKWPIKFKSEFWMGKDFYFRDSLKLKDETFIKRLTKFKKLPERMQKVTFEPLMLSGVPPLYDSTLSSSYYYGKDPKTPKIGDIKISMFGLMSNSRVYEEVPYHLVGHWEEDLVKQYNPFKNKYILITSSQCMSNNEPCLRDYMTRNLTGASSFYLWFVRIILGLLLIFAFINVAKRKS